MSESAKPLAEHSFRFGGHTLLVTCRRLPEEVARVTQTLQLDVDELFANLLDWNIGKEEPQPAEQQQALDCSSNRADGKSRQDERQPSAAEQRAGQQAAGSPVSQTASGAAGEQQHQGQDQDQQGSQQNNQQQDSQQEQNQQQGPSADSKRLCGNVASDQPDLIGLDVWPASVALCSYLAASPGLVRGKAVCELGAGVGLPGLLAAKLGASHVLLTDYEPAVVERMQASAERNGVAPITSCLALDWFNLSPLAPGQRRAFDLLLLADVIYAAAVVGPLVATLLALLRPHTGVALVAHRIRRPLIFDRVDKIARLQERDEIFKEFQAACRASGLRLRFLNDSPAAQAGDEPLLLVIGASEEELRRFPGAADSQLEGTAAAAGQAEVATAQAAGQAENSRRGGEFA